MTQIEQLTQRLIADGVPPADVIPALRRLGFKTHEARAAVEAYSPPAPAAAAATDPAVEVLARAERNHQTTKAVLLMVRRKRAAWSY